MRSNIENRCRKMGKIQRVSLHKWLSAWDGIDGGWRWLRWGWQWRCCYSIVNVERYLRISNNTFIFDRHIASSAFLVAKCSSHRLAISKWKHLAHVRSLYMTVVKLLTAFVCRDHHRHPATQSDVSGCRWPRNERMFILDHGPTERLSD